MVIVALCCGGGGGGGGVGVAAAPAGGGCPRLPSAVNDLTFVGAGHCTNAQGLTPRAYVCNATASAECVLIDGDVDSCAIQCKMDDGCTGFEVVVPAPSPNARWRNVTGNTTTTTITAPGGGACRVFYYRPPVDGLLPWVLLDNGTQLINSSRRTVVQTDGVADGTCCYRRSYPRPCPLDMPIPLPPKQSNRTKEIFADRSARAEAASAAIMPALERLVEFCLLNSTSTTYPDGLFGVASCPGLADLTENGTLGPYPSPAQIIRRFGDEMKALEYGHGYAPLWDGWGCQPGVCLADRTQLFNPAFPMLLNLYQPLTLGFVCLSVRPSIRPPVALACLLSRSARAAAVAVTVQQTDLQQ